MLYWKYWQKKGKILFAYIDKILAKYKHSSVGVILYINIANIGRDVTNTNFIY